MAVVEQYRLMKVLKPDGPRHHGVGIQRTVHASRTITGVEGGRVALIERALAVLQARR